MKLVSTLTPEFWPGLQTLAWSLREKGKLSGMEWIVIWDGKPPANAKRILEDNGFSMTFLQSRDLGSLI